MLLCCGFLLKYLENFSLKIHKFLKFEFVLDSNLWKVYLVGTVFDVDSKLMCQSKLFFYSLSKIVD